MWERIYRDGMRKGGVGESFNWEGDEKGRGVVWRRTWGRDGGLIHHVMSLWTSVGASMEMPPFAMTSPALVSGIAIMCLTCLTSLKLS